MPCQATAIRFRISAMAECTKKRLLLLCALGILTLIVFSAMGGIENATLALNAYVGFYLIAFLLYLLAIKVASGFSGIRLLVIVWCFAVLFRLVLLPVRPTISTDIYRYIWDGRVQAEGINPYAYAPNSPHLAYLRNADWFWINHREDHTTYPPVSQLAFAATVRLFGSSVYPLKAVLILFDLATMFVVGLILRHLRMPSGAVIVYAWSPVVITEIADAGHQDSIGAMLLILALYLLIRRRQSWLPGVLLAASGLVKPYPLVAAPMLARRNWVRFPSMLVITAVILYLPFLGSGAQWLSGLNRYGFGWHRNDSLFSLMNHVLAMVTSKHEYLARMVVIFATVGLSAYMAFRRHEDDKSLLRDVFIVLAVVFLLSPTVYPWYFIWTVPFLCIVSCPAWLLLTGLTALCYVIPIYGQRDIQLLVYLPVYALLLWPMVKSRLRS